MYSGGFGFDAANSIAIDQQGFVYVTGYFESYAWFASTNQEEVQYRRGFVRHLPRPIRSTTGCSSGYAPEAAPGGTMPTTSQLMSAGYPYLTGLFREDFMFGERGEVYASGDGESNAFLARFNADGDLEGFQTIEGKKSEGFALDVDRGRCGVHDGVLRGRGPIRRSASPSLTSASTNTFMAKYPAVSFAITA